MAHKARLIVGLARRATETAQSPSSGTVIVPLIRSIEDSSRYHSHVSLNRGIRFKLRTEASQPGLGLDAVPLPLLHRPRLMSINPCCLNSTRELHLSSSSQISYPGSDQRLLPITSTCAASSSPRQGVIPSKQACSTSQTSRYRPARCASIPAEEPPLIAQRDGPLPRNPPTLAANLAVL